MKIRHLFTLPGALPEDIEALPAILLIWRSMTPWIDRLGIVILAKSRVAFCLDFRTGRN